MRRLRQRYLSMGLGELASVLVFTFAAAINLETLRDADAIAALWFALVPLQFVLLQAGIYWLLARRWLGTSDMPRPVARVFTALRVLDPIILAIGLVGLCANLPSSQLVTVVLFAVWVFGLIEYFNYYLVRLAYPWSLWLSEIGRWRTPRLIKDLRAAR